MIVYFTYSLTTKNGSSTAISSQHQSSLDVDCQRNERGKQAWTLVVSNPSELTRLTVITYAVVYVQRVAIAFMLDSAAHLLLSTGSNQHHQLQYQQQPAVMRSHSHAVASQLLLLLLLQGIAAVLSLWAYKISVACRVRVAIISRSMLPELVSKLVSRRGGLLCILFVRYTYKNITCPLETCKL